MNFKDRTTEAAIFRALLTLGFRPIMGTTKWWHATEPVGCRVVFLGRGFTVAFFLTELPNSRPLGRIHVRSKWWPDADRLVLHTGHQAVRRMRHDW